MGGQGIAATVPQQSQNTGLIPCTMRDSAMGGAEYRSLQMVGTPRFTPYRQEENRT
jgi:hypothetical protein